MTKTEITPKALLRDRDLLGFRRSSNGGNQTPQRATSAKVTSVEPTDRKEPARGTTSPRAER